MLIGRVRALLLRTIGSRFPRSKFRRRGNLYSMRRPPLHISAYYRYCAHLLQEGFTLYSGPPREKKVWLCLPEQVSIAPKTAEVILLQVEHTLVAPGGRDSSGAPQGSVPLLNVEGTYLVRLEGGEAAYAEARSIIEYSKPNILNVAGSGLASAYEDSVEYIAPLTASPGGSQSPRRSATIATMHGGPLEGRRGFVQSQITGRGLDVYNILDKWNNFDAVFDDVAILLNVHQTESHHTLEELRILPAVLRQVIVVTEEYPLAHTVPYADFLISAPYDELAETAIHVAENYETFWRNIYGSQRVVEMHRELTEANDRAVQRIVRRCRENH